MRIETRTEQRARVFAESVRQVPGRTLPRGAQWIGADIPGRSGAQRRRRQRILNGAENVLWCAGCTKERVARGRQSPFCDTCLQKKFGTDTQSS